MKLQFPWKYSTYVDDRFEPVERLTVSSEKAEPTRCYESDSYVLLGLNVRTGNLYLFILSVFNQVETKTTTLM